MAQDKKPLLGDVMLDKYLAAETDKLAKKFMAGARTIKEWQEIRPRLEREYLDMLGLWPVPEKTPLKATVTGSFEHEGLIIEKLHFQSMPGLYVTANFYRPKDAKGAKLPTVLYVCGHSNRGRDGSKSAYQDHPLWFASNGYNCLILDTHQLGEVPGVHHGTYGRPWGHLKAYGITKASRERVRPEYENRFWWHSAGYTPAGVECWNGIRAIDYLLTRPEVDAERIGVTGISGGGAATIWIAAADPRVKVAVPVSGMSDLESYVKNKVINGHCDCMFLYNTYQWDWTTIAALIAPRPLLFANSDMDPIFPMDGNRRVIEKLHMIYAKYGKPELVDEYVSKGGHAYRPDLRVAIFQFINKHLKGDVKSPIKDIDVAKIDGPKLRVFPIDDDLPKDAINDKIDESFVARAKVSAPKKKGFDAWRKTMLAALKERSFRAIETPLDPPTAPFAEGQLVGRGKSAVFIYMEKEDFAKIGDYAEFAKAYSSDSKNGAILYYPRFYPFEGGDSAKELDDLHAWTRKSPPNFAERSLLLLGRTADERKVRHVIETAQKLARSDGVPKWDGRIVGKGPAGVIAAYAALFEPAIKEVILIDPPASHMNGPHFLGVLRVLDVPEALGLLAPRKLTIIGAHPAFNRTAAIYKAAGAADKFIRK